MPDPSISDALAEAAALAPADELIHHTIELRHPSFIDEAGNPDSIWVVQGTEDLQAPIEAGAPVRGGQTVNFTAFAFSFALAGVEESVTAEIDVTLDGVTREVIEHLDAAMESNDPIVMVYRVYLDSDLADGPQRLPPDQYELSEVHCTATSVKAKARVGIDLRGQFPRKLYTAQNFPGLVGR